MAFDTIDERTFILRDMRENATKKRRLMRLGNTAPIEQGTMTDEEFAQKKEAGKAALQEAVMKQMVWWKAADDEHQPKPTEDDGEEVPTLVDIWLTNGTHINTMLTEQGHLSKAEEYQSEISRNILSANSQEEKKKAYEELAEAMKENEEYRKQQAAEARRLEEENA